jgi:hypothetical protein
MKLTRCSGFWTSVLAVVHLAMAPAFYGDSVRSSLDAGVLGAVDSDPDLATLRGAAFWYVTVGLFLGLIGWVVMVAERRGQGAPRGFAMVMAATGVWGGAARPGLGVLALLPHRLAGLAQHRTRSYARTCVVTAAVTLAARRVSG